jgi:hypothetical protein
MTLLSIATAISGEISAIQSNGKQISRTQFTDQYPVHHCGCGTN